MKSEVKLTTGERLKDLRKKADLTSEELCKELADKHGYYITKSKYNEIENDKAKDFGYKAFKYFALYYNVSTDYLLGLEEEPTTKYDLKIAKKVTGLSEKAIEHLEYISSNNVVYYDERNKAYYLPNDKLQLRIAAINKLIVSEEFAQLIDNLVYLERLTSDICPCKEDDFEQRSKNDNLSNSADICRYNVFRTREKICNLFDRREQNG